MTEWIFDRNGMAKLLFDDDCIRNDTGQVIAWISGVNVYSLNGRHVGWFENGVLYDSKNKMLGFIRNVSGYLPSMPGISGVPGTPGLSGKPGRPGLSGNPGRPSYGGWSEENLGKYFNSK